MIVRFLAALAFVVFAQPAAADAGCSLNYQQWLSKELSRLKTWRAIHESFRLYVPRCDDGFLAEGFTEAAVVLLARRWAYVRELAAMVKHDRDFGTFDLRRIDASADPANLKEVQVQAAERCPSKHKAICSSIHTAAAEAIKNL
jgi:hypothetical protein